MSEDKPMDYYALFIIAGYDDWEKWFVLEPEEKEFVEFVRKIKRGENPSVSAIN